MIILCSTHSHTLRPGGNHSVQICVHLYNRRVIMKVVIVALALLFALSCASPRGGRGGGRGGRGGRRVGGGGGRSSRSSSSSRSSYASSSGRYKMRQLRKVQAFSSANIFDSPMHVRAKPQWIKDAREPYMFNMDSVIKQIRTKKVSTWFGTRISGSGWRPSYKKKNLGK